MPSIDESFLAKSCECDRNEKNFCHQIGVIDHALEDLERYGPPEHMWEAIFPDIQNLVDGDPNEDLAVLLNADFEDDEDENALPHPENLPAPADGPLHTVEKDPARMSRDEYRNAMLGLNTDQRAILTFHRIHIKKNIKRWKDSVKMESYQIFLSGPGGVG